MALNYKAYLYYCCLKIVYMTWHRLLLACFPDCNEEVTNANFPSFDAGATVCVSSGGLLPAINARAALTKRS